MENENFAASKPNDPLMSQNNQAQQPKTVTVAVVEEEKKFLPQGDHDGVHYKKDFAQVEIKQTAPTFIGLTQEELKRYADDPFWRRLRLALFVLFWLSWILMFVIAIVLVVTSPKCPAKPDRRWWQRQLCYQTFTRTFKDSDGDGVGDFKGLQEKIKDLQRSNIQTIWPVPVLNSENFTGYDVISFTEVDSRLGSMEDFEGVIKAASENAMFVVIDLPITTISKQSHWFKESSSRSRGPFSDFLYWRAAEPPADQISQYSQLDTTRNEYYRVFKESDDSTPLPVLNWDSPSLRDEMKNVMEFWIGKGVHGFYLGRIHLMGLDANGKSDWNKIEERIGELRMFLDEKHNSTGKEIAIFTSVKKEDIDNEDHQALKERLVGPDRLHYVLNTELATVDESCDASCIRTHIQHLHDFYLNNNDSWPVWEIGSPYVSRVASRFNNNKEKVELFQMLLFMLEGSVNTYYGDELGLVDANEADIKLSNPKKFVMRSPMQWDDGKNAGFSDSNEIPIPPNPDYTTNNLKESLAKGFSAAKLYRKMAEWRTKDETFLFGNMELAPLNETAPSVIGLTRKAYPPSPNYFAILNFGNVTYENFDLGEKLNFTLPKGSGDPTVGVMTSNLASASFYRNRDVIDHKTVKLLPYSGIVIKYK